jgi:sirohydrochlorin cobaltochelatase
MFFKPHSALIIAAHGSSVDPHSNAPTRAHADEIRRRGVFGEVVYAFFKEQPRLRDALRLVGSGDVYVVPNCISEGWFTRQIIPREMQLSGPMTVRNGRTIKYCQPAGSHPRMTEVLLHRAAQVAPDVPRDETSLLIIGHGTDRDANSSAAVREQVARIRARGEFAEVVGAFLDESPCVSEWDKLTKQRHVIAVPFFIADGMHTRADIPALLGTEAARGGAAGTRDVFQRIPHRVRGRELHYASAIGTEPLFADAILDQVEAFDSVAQPSFVISP